MKIVLTDYDDDREELLDAMNHPNKPEMGTRQVPFCREIYIEQDDFMIDAPRKFYRLKPGGEVRLRAAYIIRCDEVIKDQSGNVVELHCSHDPDTRSGTGSSDRKVKGTIHWVSARHAVDAEVRLYDRLFTDADPAAADDLSSVLNASSLDVVSARLEPALARVAAGTAYQFERLGYFCPDVKDHGAANAVFNRIVTLRDGWAKIEKQALASR